MDNINHSFNLAPTQKKKACTLDSEVGNLVFQPHRHFKLSGALITSIIYYFTYSLAKLEVNKADVGKLRFRARSIT
jgi:hypothetical protein